MSQVELFEQERATNYNHFVANWIPNYYNFLEQLPRLLQHTNHKRLLIAGCGTGNEIAYFLNHSPDWKITGVDPSPEMIVQAEQRYKDNTQVTLVTGLVADLDKNELFSAATLLLVLHFLEGYDAKLNLLKDIAERLSTNATLVMLDITGDKQQIANNLSILKLLLPSELEEGDVENRLYRIANKLFPIAEPMLIQLCQEAGFSAPVRFFQSTIYVGWHMTKIN